MACTSGYGLGAGTSPKYGIILSIIMYFPMIALWQPVVSCWNGRSARMALDLAVSPRAVPGCEQCYDVALMDRYPPDSYCEDGREGGRHIYCVSV